MHDRLDEMRKKYGDSDTLNNNYLEHYLKAKGNNN